MVGHGKYLLQSNTLVNIIAQKTKKCDKKTGICLFANSCFSWGKTPVMPYFKPFVGLVEVSLQKSLKTFTVPRFVLKPHFESARRYCVSAVFLTVDFIISHGFPT